MRPCGHAERLHRCRGFIASKALTMRLALQTALIMESRRRHRQDQEPKRETVKDASPTICAAVERLPAIASGSMRAAGA